MKFLLLIFFTVLYSPPDELKVMRNLFPMIDKNEASAIALKNMSAEAEKVSINLQMAYSGASEIVMAKYEKNPLTKLNTFKTGKSKLEKAIQLDSLNIEARYIRYVIQDNVPSILAYNKNLSRDRQFLISHVSEIKKSDAQLYIQIVGYLIAKGKLDQEENKMISN